MRRRLFLVTLAVTSVLVAAFAFPLAVLVGDVARDRAITEADRDISQLATVLVLGQDQGLLEAAVAQTTSGQQGRLSVWLPDGRTVGDDASPRDDAVELARAGQEAFSRTSADGITVYSPVIIGADQEVVVLRVRVPEAILTDGVAASWGVLAILAAVLLILSVLATDRLARTVTRPAADLARTSRELARGDMTARAEVAGPPEIAEVADALNLLADRIDELLIGERERVADLSHRLRTPLTALRLDAEGHGATALITDVDRLEVEITELIRAARLPLRDTATERVDLAQVAADRVAFWGALADDDGRRWSCVVTPPGPHYVRVGSDDAAAVVDVLLGNVFAHTPEGTAYQVSVTASDGRVRLAIEDAGAGIADPHSLFDRGSSAAGSTGLGLDIARSTARSGGGDVRVEGSPLGGTRVVFDLPLADDSR